MEKNEKILPILLFIILITSATFPITTATDDPKTIYVDDEFSDNPENHTWNSIQEGINDARTGDTVYVFNGNYKEIITLNKSIVVNGENKAYTIIDGQDQNESIVSFSADQSTLSNFTIQSSGLLGTGIRIRDYSHNSVLNCHLCNHRSESLHCQNAPFTTVNDCSITKSTIGIDIGTGCNHSTITQCDIDTNRTSLRLSSSYSKVSQCVLHESLTLRDGAYNQFHHCTISADLKTYGIQMGYTSFNTFTNISLHDCGIIFHVNYPHQLYHDIDTSNRINGKPIMYLVDEHDKTINESVESGYLGLISCHNVTVEHQNIHGGVIGNSTHCLIKNIRSKDNSHGISIHLSESCSVKNSTFSHAYPIKLFKSSDITISNCTMLEGHPYGIGVYLDYYTSNSTISQCRIDRFWDGIAITSDSVNNHIDSCILRENRVGISILTNNNIVSNCNISDNGLGVAIEARDNMIIRNNFFENELNAASTGYNQWCNGTTGNYWDNWIGLKFGFLSFLPYHIRGTLCSNIDWHPNLEMVN